MNKSLAEHYAQFQSSLNEELLFKVKLVKELEVVLKWLNYGEAYKKLQYKIIKEKYMVNAICKFNGQEPIYDLEPNQYLQLRCELELQNRMLKNMVKGSYKDICEKIDETRIKKLDGYIKKTRTKTKEKEQAIKNIDNHFEITKDNKVQVKDEETFNKTIDFLKEDNIQLTEIVKTIDKAMQKEESKDKQQELQLKASNQ